MAEPDKIRRRILNLNNVLAMISNLSTSYNLVNIQVVHRMLENEYCHHTENDTATTSTTYVQACDDYVTAVSTACLVGAILGQLTFGYVGDCIGRGVALRLTMLLSFLGSLISAFSVPLGRDPSSIFVFVALARLVLGIGVGGVYPLAATISAESSSKTSRGRTGALVFSMQGIWY